MRVARTHTKDAALFEQVCEAGARLLYLHTYGERFIPGGRPHGQVPLGEAKCVKTVPGDADAYPEDFDYIDATRTLRVGGGEFAPVAPEVYDFDVSGLKVVQSWLSYRMKEGAGKKSSPLDDIRPRRWTSQRPNFSNCSGCWKRRLRVIPNKRNCSMPCSKGECFRADELPPVPAEMRNAPKAEKPATTLPLEIPD